MVADYMLFKKKNLHYLNTGGGEIISPVASVIFGFNIIFTCQQPEPLPGHPGARPPSAMYGAYPTLPAGTLPPVPRPR